MRIQILGFIMLILLTTNSAVISADEVNIGLNYPRTGPYHIQGLDQWRATELAVEEINSSGGILGNKIKIIWRDSRSQPDITRENVADLIDNEGVKMVFGGSSSGVAVAAGHVCQEKGIIFFGTLTYSTATTGTDGHRHTFRECYDSWMGAKVLGKYLRQKYAGKKYFYITADYTWGWTTEDSLRKATGTTNKTIHKGILTPFPTSTADDFKNALKKAQKEQPDVLVLVLFGTDMSNAINIANAYGMKKNMQIVVPNITLGMAEGAGPMVMEGVVGALPWTWRIPYKYNYAAGKKFIETFAKRYNRYPSTSGASAYTILYEYKSAVERAGTFDSAAVIKALEDHEYTLLKDKQKWRKFDHQSIQTVYAVKCNSPDVVNSDKYKLDYFTILSSMEGKEAVQTRDEWVAIRLAAGKSPTLEPLPGE